MKITKIHFLKKRLPGFLLYLAKTLFEGVVIAGFAGLSVYLLVTLHEAGKARELALIRASLHGMWVVQINIDKSDLPQYKELILVDIASLTVDSGFDLSGAAYKWREYSKLGEIEYPRQLRASATISGSIMEERVLMNWITRDEVGGESIQILDGKIERHGYLTGSFHTDVASSSGTFCARRISVEDMKEKNIPETVCEDQT